MNYGLIPAKSRALRVCDSAAPICPRCNKIMLGFTAFSGATVRRCENHDSRELAVREKRSVVRGRCGQHVYIFGMGEGLCLTMQIAPGEFEDMRANKLPLFGRDLFRQLGVLEPVPQGR